MAAESPLTTEQADVEMDGLIGQDTVPAALYRRWEKQQWAVSDLDFSQDKADWLSLPEGIRQVTQNTMTLFFIGEQAVTDTLAPLLHAAPREDERVFLATQIADEARHTVFFQRFFGEVLGLEGGLTAALEAVRARTGAGFRKIFNEHPAGAGDLGRRGTRDHGGRGPGGGSHPPGVGRVRDRPTHQAGAGDRDLPRRGRRGGGRDARFVRARLGRVRAQPRRPAPRPLVPGRLAELRNPKHLTHPGPGGCMGSVESVENSEVPMANEPP